MTTERRYSPAEVAALPRATAADLEDLEKLEKLRAERWAALERSIEEQAERRYEESVQHRLSDLRHQGTWWCYGYVYPVTEGDTAQGWGVWRARAATFWLSGESEQARIWAGLADDAEAMCRRVEERG